MMNSTTSTPNPAAPAGQENETAGEIKSITVRLTNQQAAGLDQMAALIRRNTGAVLNRSAVLRGFADGILQYSGTFINCRSEKEVSQKVVRVFEFVRTNEKR